MHSCCAKHTVVLRVPSFPSDMDAAARYTELRADSAAVFGKIGSFLADLCEGSQLHTNLAEVSVDTKLGSFHETFSSLQARHVDQNLTVAVLALTKSGESRPMQLPNPKSSP